MDGHKEGKVFHPHTEHPSLISKTDVITESKKVKETNFAKHLKGRERNKEVAKEVMNKKLDKAGVGTWYRSLYPNDRSTIFEIAESRTKKDFGNVRFDLYGFPLQYANEFVRAVVDWRVAKRELAQDHNANQIKSLLIKQKRAEQFKGVSNSKLNSKLKGIGNRENNKKLYDDIREEKLQRELHFKDSRLFPDRLHPSFPSRGDPFSNSQTLEAQ